MEQQNTKRVLTIDGIRGISLLGILLANLLIFQYGIWGKDELQLFDVTSFDEWMYAFTKIGIEDSFMPIFTFLFGYSMIMMRDSLARRNLRIKWHFFRRSLMLVVLGLLHGMIFLWEGDILLLYGAMGIFLLFFVNRKAKTMLVWGIILFSLLGLISVIPDDEAFINQEVMDEYVIETTDVFSNGTYNEIKTYSETAEDPMFATIGDMEMLFILLISPLTVAPMFLFGMYAAKRGRFVYPQQERKGYWRLIGVGLIAGFILKVYGFIEDQEAMLSFGGMILSFGYIGILGLIYSYGIFDKILHCFENVGKLSLTNYIMQTAICVVVFYGYGFGQFGKMGIGWAILLGLLIYGMQIAFSSLYLEKFRYGPLEKIVRVVTYLKWKNPSKKSKQEAA